MPFRFIAVLILCGSCFSAETEQFTLADGRVLVGTYDATAHRMTSMVTGISASFRVEPSQIVKRRPFAIEQVPAHTEEKSSDPEPITPVITIERSDAMRVHDREVREFEDTYKVPYLPKWPDNSRRKELVDIPAFLRGEWNRVTIQANGDSVGRPIYTASANLLMLGNSSKGLLPRAIYEVSADGETLGYEFKMGAGDPWIVRGLGVHKRSLTRDGVTSVFVVSQQGP